MSDPVSVSITIEATISAGSDLLPVPLTVKIPLLHSVGKVSNWDAPDDLRYDCQTLAAYWLGSEWENFHESNVSNTALLLQGVASSTSILNSIGDSDE